MPTKGLILISLLMIPTAVFAALVVLVCCLDRTYLDEPLSNFRYGNYATLGYSAFAMLITIGIVYVYSSQLYGEYIDKVFSISSLVAIVIVAFTPSYHFFHEIVANGLMFFMFCFIAIKLYESGSYFSLFIHVFAPVILLCLLSAFSRTSSGMFQKTFIFYLVFLIDATVLFLILTHQTRFSAKKKKAANRVTVKIPSPKVIYRKNRWDRVLDNSTMPS